ncbi:MAG TPA: carboxypeptidase regulatory-like domain-containing protein [Flexivirga sp.]|uniref:carboxypeptidase regulatory-like domain-containing protein n=1 Tax=Flexivirga sp. TaxID=1962927 RepID=UPI002BBAB798|nr:carboxypeptidase regulatory-like domain-containing protein [Flexivirga sp.]HWC22579.1 carboxypeptidase regulatory-like domain-containing protein [Flexivirga sp.]
MSRIDELATGPIDGTDEQILHALGEIVSASDPVPAALTDRVKFALTVEALGAQVAELLEQQPAGVRSAYDTITTVTFSGDEVTVLLTLDSEHRPRRRITGWLSTPEAGVQVHGPDGEVAAEVDEDGRFEVDFSRSGLVHLVIQPTTEPPSRPVVTPPIQI